jgi:hypothetical protein
MVYVVGMIVIVGVVLSFLGVHPSRRGKAPIAIVLWTSTDAARPHRSL